VALLIAIVAMRWLDLARRRHGYGWWRPLRRSTWSERAPRRA